MRVGILQADDLRDELKPTFDFYPRMFEKMLSGRGFHFVTYDVRADVYPDDVEDCDAYLITGSRHGVYDSLPWLEALFAYIRRLHLARRPTLGICFGHQAVAHALGGCVEKSTKGWGLGLQSWNIIDNSIIWMNSPTPSSSLRLLCMHQDQVVALPEDARLLAGSTFCPHAAFAIDEHVFCLQGHPEFSRDYMRALLIHRQEAMAMEVFQHALDSVDLPSDHDACADWITNFFKLPRSRSVRSSQ